MAFIIRRLALGVITVFAVASLTFGLIHAAPGEPFGPLLDDARMTEARRTAFRERYGLDRPVAEQFVRYSGQVIKGNFGESFARQRPAASLVLTALPRTLLLMGTALILGALIGIVVGVWQAMHRGSRAERVVDTLVVGLGAIPDFWIALALMIVFGLKLRWFPVSGIVDEVMHDYMSPGAKLLDVLRHLALPATSLALLVGALIARHQRAALEDVLPEDFIRTAYAKGLSRSAVIRRHALRNALLPTITLLGLLLPVLVGGAVFIEYVFAWPGLGTLAVESLLSRDYPVVLATTIFASIAVVVGNLLADLALAYADPRLRV